MLALARAGRLLGLLALWSCSEDIPPSQNFGGEPLWTEVDLAGAVDLGGTPSETSGGQPGVLAMMDATQSAGLDRVASGGNTHGVGVAFVELTGDQLPDILVVNGRTNDGTSFPTKLLANRGDGSFEDVTSESGLDFLSGRDGYSVAAADFDADGDADLYLGFQPHDVLLENDGLGHFTNVTEARGAGGPRSDEDGVRSGVSKIVSFGDYDQDGWIDVASASATLDEPHAYLLRNLGDGQFEDVTDDTGVFASPSGNPCAMLFSDYDNDADADLWIWNDRGDKVLLQNEDGRRYVDITDRANLDAVAIRNPMGIDGADFDHDGDLDYYVSNIGNNPFLRNNGDGTFSDIHDELDTGGEFGWGLGFEDFDLDGRPDLFVAQEDDLPHLLFQNRGSAEPFTRIELTHPPVLSSGAAHNVAAAFADYDRDGRVDVVVAHTDGSNITLYRNIGQAADNHWLSVSVHERPDGRLTRGVGARVFVKTGELLQFREIYGGSSRASQSEHTARFGLGGWEAADWVAVQWPDGQQWVASNVPADQHLVFPVEP